MSLSDLGGALLSRSSKIRSQRESRSKRQEKVNKILAVLLGGQAIFQKQKVVTYGISTIENF